MSSNASLDVKILQVIDRLPPAHRVPLHNGEVVNGPEDGQPRLQDDDDVDDDLYAIMKPLMIQCGKVYGVYNTG